MKELTRFKKERIWHKFLFVWSIGILFGVIVTLFLYWEPEKECPNYLVVELPDGLAESVSSDRGVWLKIQAEEDK